MTRAKESKAALDLHRPTDQRSPTEPVLEAAAADLPVEVVRRLEAELEAASVRATPIGRGLEVAIRRRWRRTFEAARELPARQRAAVIKVYAAHLLGAPLAPDAGEAQAFARGAFQFWSDGGEP